MRLLVVLVLMLACAAAPAAERWQIDHSASRLGFIGTQQGGEFDGEFESFQAQMQFSPDDLANSRFDVTIDVASIDTGSPLRDEQLPGEDWFHVDEYPTASYVTREIRAVGDGYEAVGDLTIRGNTHEVVLPFTWRIDGDTATMDGRVEIDRTRYGVGQGEWANADEVGRTVTVVVDLTLTRAGG
jgi:polyisoprenoid-binding protein YceI